MSESNLALIRKYVDELLSQAEKIIQGVNTTVNVKTLSELIKYFNTMEENVEASSKYLGLLLHINKYLFDIFHAVLIHLKTLNDVLNGNIDSRNFPFIFEFEEAKFESIEHTVLKLCELVKKIEDAELKNKIIQLTGNCLNALCVFTKTGLERKIFDAENYLSFVRRVLSKLKELLDYQ